MRKFIPMLIVVLLLAAFALPASANYPPNPCNIMYCELP